MIRAGVLVAALLLSCPAHAVPCWVVRKAVVQYGEAAVESWARAKGFPTKKSRRRSDASGDPQQLFRTAKRFDIE
jgi:hypothetical protein